MRVRFCLVVALLSLAGCATQPQRPIPLAPLAASPHSEKVGIAMAPLPTVDTQTPGASCLLCLAAASMANSKLTSYSHTLSEEDLPKLKNRIADSLRSKSIDTVVIDEPVDLRKLPDAHDKGPDMPKKDFSSLRSKYGIDHLIVIEIHEIGFERAYSAYIPTSAPLGVVRGLGYEINLSNNHYEWYMPVNTLINAEGKWDEPPSFPGLTNAYFQALEISQDSFLKPFKG